MTHSCNLYVSSISIAFPSRPQAEQMQAQLGQDGMYELMYQVLARDSEAQNPLWTGKETKDELGSMCSRVLIARIQQDPKDGVAISQLIFLANRAIAYRADSHHGFPPVSVREFYDARCGLSAMIAQGAPQNPDLRSDFADFELQFWALQSYFGAFICRLKLMCYVVQDWWKSGKQVLALDSRGMPANRLGEKPQEDVPAARVSSTHPYSRNQGLGA